VISYRPPAGGFGGGIAHILNPVFKNMVDNDVRNFKQYMDIDAGDLSGGNNANYEEPMAFVIEETVIEEIPYEEPADKGKNFDKLQDTKTLFSR
jgi:hypothetical protein